MKNLEKFGVVELKQEELVEVEGEWWQIIIGAIILDALLNPDVAIASMQEGFNATQK